ncbi:methyl-accepting chemotaxis protein [Ureibacillus suwonensis]|uniref:Methyl-accepting chemotaxis protein n=1 Tax=Ureibacillus suwonensis TaxID=313007 RepID=A0ABW0RJL2_9BACL
MFFMKKIPLKTEYKEAASSPQMDGQIQVAVDQLKGVVEQMNLTSLSLEEISKSTEAKTAQLFTHSEQTVSFSQEASEKMKAIEAAALHISSFSQEILSNSQTSYAELQNSFVSFQTLQQKFEHLSRSHNDLLEQMHQLVEYSNKIQEIVYTIGSISQKTKILALNASIEAARAGDHGKGFSVVAKEVGNLANQTSQAVEETRDTIQIIQTEIKSTAEKVKLETAQVHEGFHEMNKILDALESFKGKLNIITKMVQESSESVDEQRDSVVDIANLLQEIADMALENKKYVVQVTTDLRTQHKNIEEIRSINQALTKTSSELQTLVHENGQNVQYDETLVKQVKNMLSQKVQSKTLLSMDEKIHQLLLDEILYSNPQLETIWTNRRDGTFIYSNPPAGLVNAKMRPWFKEAINGKEYVSEPYISAVTKNYCITLSFPIVSEGKIIGVLGADMALKENGR